MPYSRTFEASALPEGARLTSDMAGIGMLFATEASAEPNIEDTIVAASVEGLERDDPRVLAVLTTWVGVHHPRVNADRLLRALTSHASPRVRAYWAAIGCWLRKDRRLARLTALYDGPRIDLLRSGSQFQLRRRGEDPRFAGTGLRVPAGVLRDRPSDVLSPEDLAARHGTYRLRVLIGPSYRADMWAALEREPETPAAVLARRTYGSFATAWSVKRDWTLLHAKADVRTRAGVEARRHRRQRRLRDAGRDRDGSN